jgi:tetratricopeptide (TPR) repeat protein
LLAGALWYWRRDPPPAEPPLVALEDAEPEVRAAIESATAKVRREPRSAQAWGSLGKVLQAHRCDEESTVCFIEAARLDPADPRWPYLQAMQLLTIDPPEAVPLLRRAAECCERQGSDGKEVRVRLAETLFQVGQCDEASTLFEVLLANDPDNPRVRLGLGLVAYARGDDNGAVGHLNRALASGSPCARQKACEKLAAVYHRLGKDDLAADFSRRVGQLPRDTPWPDAYVEECTSLAVGRTARYAEVQRLKAAGRTEDGLKSLREMAREYPGERSQVGLGTALAEAQKYEQAEPVLRDALRLAPKHVQAHYYLSLSLYYLGERALRAGDRDKARERFGEGAEHAAQALRFKADHASAHLYRGLCLKRLEKLPDAIDSFRKAVACREERPEFHLALGEALAENRQWAEALDCLQKAVQLAPGDAKYADALARVRSEAKKTP